MPKVNLSIIFSHLAHPNKSHIYDDLSICKESRLNLMQEEVTLDENLLEKNS